MCSRGFWFFSEFIVSLSFTWLNKHQQQYNIDDLKIASRSFPEMLHGTVSLCIRGPAPWSTSASSILMLCCFPAYVTLTFLRRSDR